MFRSNINRIAFALAMWSATVLLALRFAGLFEDDGQQTIERRQDLCELIAVHCSQFASAHNQQGIEVALTSLVARHRDVLSAALPT